MKKMKQLALFMVVATCIMFLLATKVSAEEKSEFNTSVAKYDISLATITGVSDEISLQISSNSSIAKSS